jgi:cyclophilin family peptidyl-prolyl cis-trans isomerase
MVGKVMGKVSGRSGVGTRTGAAARETRVGALAWMLGRAALATAGALLALGGAALAAEEGTAKGAKPMVLMATSLGDIKIELYTDKAPETVKNFLGYVEAKFYDGTVFHRVVPGFVIQGGGLTADLSEKPTRPPIKNEAGNGLKNTVGTLSMARTGVVDSATSQFFINVRDNPALDHRNDTPAGFGYAVFGKVTEGMDVVHKIEKVATTTRGMHQNVPVEPVVITSARVAQ